MATKIIRPYLRLNEIIQLGSVVVGPFNLGVNFSGFESGGVLPGSLNTDYFAPDPVKLDYMRAKGLKHIRLPFSWGRMQPTLNAALNATDAATAYLTQYKQAIVNCNAAGLKILIDCHSYAIHPSGQINSGLPGAPTSANFADLWGKLAAEFGSMAGLMGYDIMNEPNHMIGGPGAWPPAAQAAVNAIRLVDTVTPIYVEGDHYSSAWCWTGGFEFETAVLDSNENLHITDPSNKIVYSAHCYADFDNSGRYFTWSDSTSVTASTSTIWPDDPAHTLGQRLVDGVPVTTNVLINRITKFNDWLVLHGYKGHIGECGTATDDPAWNVVLDKALAFCQANNIEFSYWAGGPGFGPNYPFCLNPLSSGIDAVQMAVITKYTGVAQPTNYLISHPLFTDSEGVARPLKRGTVGVMSADFTIDYRGVLTSPLVLTLTDHGAGGTFTPPMVTLAAGVNASGTFTYRPSSQVIAAIGATNNLGLSNPASITSSSIVDSFTGVAAVPHNIFGLRRINSTYSGPLVRLGRDIDSATQDFGFLSDGRLDRQSIANWVGGPNSVARVITWYDQSDNEKHMDGNIAYSPQNVSASPRDYPILILTDSDGCPTVKWIATGNGRSSRRAMRGEIANITGQTIITNLNHDSGQCFLSAAGSGYEQWITASYTWSITGEPVALPMGIVPGAFKTYAGTWKAGAVNGWNTYVDGTLNATKTSLASSFSEGYRKAGFDVGFFCFSTVHWKGSVREVIILGDAITALQVATFSTDLTTAYSAPWAALSSITNAVFADSGGPALPSVLKGVNLSGSQYSSSLYPINGYDYVWPTAEQIDYYFGKGLKTIRLPFNINRVQPKNLAALEVVELGKINAVVQACRLKGMYVVLDPHNGGDMIDAYGVVRPINVSGGVATSVFVDFWSRMSAAFKNMPNVIFGLMNEPLSQTAVEWKDAAVAAVAAIRANGCTQKILVQGSYYDGAPSWTSRNWGGMTNAVAWAGFTDSNFAYEMHAYLDYDNSNSGFYKSSGHDNQCALGAGAAQLATATAWLAAEGAQGFLGEFGWTKDSTCTAEGADITAYMTTHASQWAGWTYWNSARTGDYSAASLSCDPSSPSSGNISYAAGCIDNPQMSILVANL